MTSNAFLLVAGIVVFIALVVGSFVKQTPRAQGTRPLIPARYSIVVACSLFAIGLLIKFWNPSQSHSVHATPTQASPESERNPERWEQVTIPPNEWSPVFRRPLGYHMLAKGDGFLLYNIYEKGDPCSFGNKCPQNPTGVALRNLTSSNNEVSIAFEKD